MIIKSIQFILFDIIGTTVSDRINGESIIAKNFQKAFLVNGLEVEAHQIKKERGKLKSIAVYNILKENSADIQEAEHIYHTFMALLEDDLMHFSVMRGFEGLLNELKSRKIKIGIGSGLPMNFIQKLIEKFE